MYYRINDEIALRSWQDLPHAYYEKGSSLAGPLSTRDFCALLMCNGNIDLKPNDTLASLERRGYISACEQGQGPSEWSRHKKYDNAYMPKMNLMLTGRCNYNCLHCFNAQDNAPLMSEWDFEELCGLLDQAQACGINCFTITGGEPMLYPRFMDVLREIHKRDMFVDNLNTNGYFITQRILDGMKELGCAPLMKISFDGVGFHDWMRARAGAEKRTLDAIRLCVENGFEVKIQTQVNRRNLESMRKTILLMEELGASEMRLIRTSESDRWLLNAGNASLTFADYYARMLELAKWYASAEHGMRLVMWQYLTLLPKTKEYRLHPVMFCHGKYNAHAPVCQGNRAMVALSSEGEVMPCMQMSGYFIKHGMSYGNVHDTGLKDLLSDSDYLHAICRSVGELKEANMTCASCRYFEYCCGGCRALGYLYSGEGMDGADASKCLFFKGGWHRRIAAALAGWSCLSPIVDKLA